MASILSHEFPAAQAPIMPGYFTSRGGCSRKVSGHEAVRKIQQMARNAADAAKSARPQGENLSESLQFLERVVSLTNGTG
jgi:hypothetical protein